MLSSIAPGSGPAGPVPSSSLADSGPGSSTRGPAHPGPTRAAQTVPPWSRRRGRRRESLFGGAAGGARRESWAATRDPRVAAGPPGRADAGLRWRVALTALPGRRGRAAARRRQAGSGRWTTRRGSGGRSDGTARVADRRAGRADRVVT